MRGHACAGEMDCRLASFERDRMRNGAVGFWIPLELTNSDRGISDQLQGGDLATRKLLS